MDISLNETTITTLDGSDLNKIGTKAMNLKIISSKLKLSIPKTQVINTDFYIKIARENKLSLGNILNWNDLVIDDSLINEVISKIDEVFGDAPLVIRSSATCEDTPLLSFAGQYSTFLNIKGESAIKKAIKMCLCSLYSKNSLIYAKKHKVDLDSESIAILIQELVPVDMAGVIFTADPVTGDDDKIIIEYTTGLGDQVCSGEQKPITEIVSKDCFSDSPVKNVVTAALEIENMSGEPRDIEWGIKDDRVYIFQNRPITTGAVGKNKISNNRDVINQGTPASSGIAFGKLVFIDEEDDLSSLTNGSIVYLRGYTGMKVIEHEDDISGIITKGGVLSHMSVIARELNIPSICNFEGGIDNYIGKNVYINGFNGELST